MLTSLARLRILDNGGIPDHADRMLWPG